LLDREVFPAFEANPPLRLTVAIFEVTRLFARARAAMTIFQLAFPGRVKYCQVCIYTMCDLRGLPCALLRSAGGDTPAGLFSCSLS
jgi:hypothetical protein